MSQREIWELYSDGYEVGYFATKSEAWSKVGFGWDGVTVSPVTAEERQEGGMTVLYVPDHPLPVLLGFPCVIQESYFEKVNEYQRALKVAPDMIRPEYMETLKDECLALLKGGKPCMEPR